MIFPRRLEVEPGWSVRDEIFGPVLQIVRWGSGRLKSRSCYQ
jgi:delta 1-pyrroline-5-carboxylate dehydrogenase